VLSEAQWAVGDHPAAMTTKQDRIDLYKRLVQTDPSAYQPQLEAAQADLATTRIRRRKVLGGLIHEYERVA